MKRLTFFLLVFVLILTGCFGNRVKPSGEPAPVLKIWTSDEILDVVGQRTQAIRQVKALITVKVDGKKPSGFFLPIRTLDAALWTERPRPPAERAVQIRLQGFNPLGGTLFDLVSKDGRPQLSVPGRSKEVQQRLEEMLIRNGARSSFPYEILDALAGGGQPLMRPSESTAIEQSDGEIIVYQFLLEADGRSRLIRKYWLDDRLLTKQAAYFAPTGRPSVTLVYRDYQTVPSSGDGIEESFWPHEITVNFSEKGQLTVTFREVLLNQPFQAGAFSLGALSK
jgi:hypothetical protein